MLLECPQEEAKRAAKEVETVMREAFLELFPEHGKLALGIAEVGIGKSWIKAKP